MADPGFDIAQIGSIVSSVGDIWSNWFTNKTNKDINNSTNQANLQLAEKQNEWNKEMWKMNHDSNTASAMVQQYKDAGLNPALMFASGTVQGNNIAPQSAPLANQQPYYVQNPNFGQLAKTLLEAGALNLQKRKIDNDTQRVTMEQIRNNISVKEFNLMLEKWKDEHKINEQQLANMKQQNEKLAFESLQIWTSINGMEQEQRIRAVDEAYKQAEKSAELQLLYKKYEVEEATVKKILADVCNAYKQGKLIDSQVEINGVEYQIKQSQAGIAQVEAQIREENKSWDKNIGRVNDVLGVAGDIFGILGSGIKSALSLKPKKSSRTTTHSYDADGSLSKLTVTDVD